LQQCRKYDQSAVELVSHQKKVPKLQSLARFDSWRRITGEHVKEKSKDAAGFQFRIDELNGFVSFFVASFADIDRISQYGTA
jgi:hypothetical protein